MSLGPTTCASGSTAPALNRTLAIDGRIIGPTEAPLVIAEIGINHGGSLAVAKEMVDAASRAGVEVVKHQTHVVEDEMSPDARKTIPGNSDQSIYEIMADAALSAEDEYELMSYVRSKGMTFISTPFSRAAADRLREFDVPAYKIGSGELNNYPLIRHVCEAGKPLIISTGMNDLAAVARAVEIVRAAGLAFALLHTTNVYPTPTRLVRLGAMQELAGAFPDAPFGLSDHTLNNHACLAAIALGASVVERHFTDRMDREGPDVVCSMDEAECRELIEAGREIQMMRGGSKGRVAEEEVTAAFAFATVVTIQDIAAGDSLTYENVWVKRPGTGSIPAGEFESLLGRRANHDIPSGTHLDWGMLDA
jgi:sialic acid synthase SpsE